MVDEPSAYQAASVRLGEKLRTLRKDRRLTQVELAAHLGIDRSFLSDLERGKKNVSLDYLQTLADGFEISLAELFQGV